MSDKQTDFPWESIPRVRLLGQPVGAGLPMAFGGGVLTYYMILALNPREPLLLQCVTLLLVMGFWTLFVTGLAFLLTPFEKVWVSRQEVQLRLGGLVLRRIPVEQIRSVSASTREIRLRKKDCDLYRMQVNCNGKWPHSRPLWIDWSIAAEETLRRHLVQTNFLL